MKHKLVLLRVLACSHVPYRDPVLVSTYGTGPAVRMGTGQRISLVLAWAWAQVTIDASECVGGQCERASFLTHLTDTYRSLSAVFSAQRESCARTVLPVGRSVDAGTESSQVPQRSQCAQRCKAWSRKHDESPGHRRHPTWRLLRMPTSLHAHPHTYMRPSPSCATTARWDISTRTPTLWHRRLSGRTSTTGSLLGASSTACQLCIATLKRYF